MAPSQRSIFTLFLMMALFSALLTACQRKGYESPAYQVLLSDGPFEIRQYPGSTLISTAMQQRGKDNSFMRLFRFISGNNERQEKISMTVPVLMSGTTSGTMSFVVPDAVARRGVPKPFDTNVSVTAMPPSRYAIFRFKGAISPSRGEAAAAKLQAWTSARKLEVSGSPFFAYYNPPWTPGFLRRNEVLIRLASEQP